MPGRAFLDSNVLIYAYSTSEPDKRRIARTLWVTPDTSISTQVLNETCNVLTRKFRVPFAAASRVVDEIVRTLPVCIVDTPIIRSALALADRHPHGYFDALMLATAAHLGCERLYSEDLQDGGNIGGLRIVNPFQVSADAPTGPASE